MNAEETKLQAVENDLTVSIGRRCIAAEQDLIIRADGHALRAGAGLERDRESSS